MLEHAVQCDLFAAERPLSTTPIARTKDPETSHLAADDLNESGTRSRQQRQVLEALRKWPGLTSADLAKKSGLERHMVAKRLADLEPVYAGKGEGKVKSASTGKWGTPWFPTGIRLPEEE